MKGWGKVLMEVRVRGDSPNDPHFPLSRIR